MIRRSSSAQQGGSSPRIPLYQQCVGLRGRLSSIQGFQEFLDLAVDPSSVESRSADPVHQLWECFSLGVPLCFLWNLLPPPATPTRTLFAQLYRDQMPTTTERQRATAEFLQRILQVRKAHPNAFPFLSHELFILRDLINDRNNISGFAKVFPVP